MARNKDTLHQRGAAGGAEPNRPKKIGDLILHQMCKTQTKSTGTLLAAFWKMEAFSNHLLSGFSPHSTPKPVILCLWIVSRAKIFGGELIGRTFLQTVLITSGRASAAAGPSHPGKQSSGAAPTHPSSSLSIMLLGSCTSSSPMWNLSQSTSQSHTNPIIFWRQR